MRSGKTILNHSQFWGYTKGSDRVLVIVLKEAEIVRKISDLYLQGNLIENAHEAIIDKEAL